MLRSRIIPCLLVQNKGLVKTVGFKEPKYVGDPINAVKIFNEKEVDELMVLDIDASAEGRGPDFEMIKNLAIECRMPLCYGGGVTTVDQAIQIINLGAEKVALSTAAIKNPSIIKDIGNAIGIQSVIVVLDIKKRKNLFGKTQYEIYINNGKEKTDLSLIQFLKKIDDIGIGELVINSIDLDGSMKGYDIELVEIIRELTEVPITVLGGAGNLSDIQFLINKFRVIGAAAGSLFVFKGKYKAVLINYPNKIEKRKLYNR
jgi:cyclase